MAQAGRVGVTYALGKENLHTDHGAPYCGRNPDGKHFGEFSHRGGGVWCRFFTRRSPRNSFADRISV
jgi:hypothetical protein